MQPNGRKREQSGVKWTLSNSIKCIFRFLNFNFSIFVLSIQMLSMRERGEKFNNGGRITEEGGGAAKGSESKLHCLSNAKGDRVMSFGEP